MSALHINGVGFGGFGSETYNTVHTNSNISVSLGTSALQDDFTRK